jgi:integrase
MDTMEILSVWHTWLAAGYAPATVEGYRGAVMRFLAANPIPIVEVDEATIAAWIESFPFRSSRRVTYFHALRNLFSWMVRHGHIERDPTALIRVPSPEEKEPRALTVEEYEAVKAAAYRHHPMRGFAAELLYFSGGRIGEVCSLTWEKVTGEGITFTKTKGGKERLIPWDESGNLRRVVEGLRDLFGEHERVLPRSEATIHEWMRKAGVDAGVPKVHPHLFRATAATRSQERGVRIVAVQRFLGHEKVTTTQRYSAVTKDEVREVADSLG